MASTSHYEPLLNEDEKVQADSERGESESFSNTGVRFRHGQSKVPRLVLVISVVFNIVAFGTMAFSFMRGSNTVQWRGERPIYSPAESAVTHVRKVFPALTDRTKWHGPPDDAVDAAWSELYRLGVSKIDGSEATRLDNQTVYLSSAKDTLAIQLDVFHLLHCLNTVRKYVWKERYPDVEAQRYGNALDDNPDHRIDHVDHCIQAVRQSLMCNADLTPNVWVWNEQRKLAQVRFDVLHTCKDWDALQAWAEENKAYVEFADIGDTHGELVYPGHNHP